MRYLLAVFLAFIASPAFAQNCPPYPYTFSPNTAARSAQVNADFQSILDCANNSLAHNGANSDITSINGLTTPLSRPQGGTTIYAGTTSTGSANAQVLAAVVPNNFTLNAGNIVTMIAGFSNTGAATLNVNSTGAVNWEKNTTTGLASLQTGDVIAGQPYYSYYDGSEFVLTNPSSAAQGTVTSVNVVDGTNGGLIFTGGPITSSGSITGSLAINDLASKTTPIATDLVAIWDVAGAAPKQATVAKIQTAGSGGGTVNFLRADGAWANPAGSSTGTLTAGTSATLSPYAASTAASAAHGLGGAPFEVICYMTNLSAELGYGVGDRVFIKTPAQNNDAVVVWANATTVGFATAGAGIKLEQKDASADSPITNSKWSITCTPYKLN